MLDPGCKHRQGLLLFPTLVCEGRLGGFGVCPLFNISGKIKYWSPSARATSRGVTKSKGFSIALFAPWQRFMYFGVF